MDNHITMNAWLQLYGERMGLNLSLNEEGTCAFLCEPDIPAVVVQSDDLFHLYAELVEFPQDLLVDTQLLMRALRLNQFQYMTGGANLLLGGTGQTIALGYSHPVEDMNPEDFCALMTSFLDKCTELQGMLLGNEKAEIEDGHFEMHSFV